MKCRRLSGTGEDETSCPCLGEGFGCCSPNVATRSGDGDDERGGQLRGDMSGGCGRGAVELGCDVLASPWRGRLGDGGFVRLSGPLGF